MTAISVDGVTLADSDVGSRTSILIEGGRITSVDAAPASRADREAGGVRRFDGDGLLASPGFIDLQLNGAAGRDLTTEPEALWVVGAALAQYGVTAFLPTLVSPGSEVVERARAAWLAGPPAGPTERRAASGGSMATASSPRPGSSTCSSTVPPVAI